MGGCCDDARRLAHATTIEMAAASCLIRLYVIGARLHLGVDSKVKPALPCGMGTALLIGAVASRSGVSAHTIRYYERLGLLPAAARTSAGYRQYGEGVVNRLMLIRNAQQFGFSLREIAAFLRLRESGGAPCRDVRQAAEHLLRAVDRQIRELIATRRRMRATLRQWDRRLARTAHDRPAYLLEMLNSSRRRAVSRRRPPSG